jgi:putative ATP-dependent endonuclease of OLD family
MYLSNLKLWNFRKFGSASGIDITTPNLDLPFNKGINILIGENDSGKTAIIDAIKLILKTHSNEWIKADNDDFFEDSDQFRIETTFTDLSIDHAKNFTEWLTWEGSGDEAKPILKLILSANRKEGRILPFDVKAGTDSDGYPLTAEAREFLKATYLRPLRDANTELIPRRNSRLSQILSSHEAFKGKDDSHSFVDSVKLLNKQIEKYFDGKDGDDNPLPTDQLHGKALKDSIDSLLDLFSNRKSRFQMSGSNLRSILEALCLLFDDCKNLGLGSHNLLFIAAELLHLQRSTEALKLGLVEEIEAHLHPQVQLQVIDTIQKQANTVQLIFTTHSPNIGSMIPLENLIICQGGKAFPMGHQYTELEETDYNFLKRFLDVTKSNLFFSKGVILVEGWAEELIIPALARKISNNLTQKGVSIINIGSTAFLRFAKIFKRTNSEEMRVPVAIVTDIDVQPIESKPTKKVKDASGIEQTILLTQSEVDASIITNKSRKSIKYDGQVVKTFVSPYWTLEYCIALSPNLRKLFYLSVLEALKEQKEDEGIQNLDAYTSAISNIETHFNSWSETKEEIAFKIYNHILTGSNKVGVAKDKISKSITAQRFAHNLESTDVGDLSSETSIKYLLNAINYASGNN